MNVCGGGVSKIHFIYY